MNFTEVMELHRAVTAFYSKNSGDRPKLCVYDNQSRDQGYILCIKANPNSSTFMDFIKDMAMARRLEIKKFRGYFVIHSYGEWNLREN
jgi:hypothetical protein